MKNLSDKPCSISSVKAAVTAILRPFGFVLKSNSYLREAGKLVHILNLQKSNYSPYYYFNLGIYSKDVNAGPPPKDPAMAHLYARATMLLPEAELALFTSASDEDVQMGQHDREARLRHTICNFLIPAFEAFENTEDLLNLARHYKPSDTGWMALRPLLIAAGRKLPLETKTM